jgi:hypothetical protein
MHLKTRYVIPSSRTVPISHHSPLTKELVSIHSNVGISVERVPIPSTVILLRTP